MPPMCVRCGAGVVYRRRYSGEALCQTCFLASIIDKTRRTISRYHLFRYGERIGVGVSGGKDSLSLLDVLAQLAPAAGSSLHVLTVDEGIAGYREEALQAASAACRRLGVPHTVVAYAELFGSTLDAALAQRPPEASSACALCGPFRRRALDLAAQRAGVDVIATAHNLDDFVQTVYLNLLTGDVARLPGLDPGRAAFAAGVPRRVKPFLEIYEEELALYAYLRGFPFQEAPCPHAAEGLRSEVRLFLNRLEQARPGIKYTALRAAVGLARQLPEPEGAAQRCAECGLPARGPICHACKTVRVLRSIAAP